jgi:hypothetical protein
MSMSHVAAAPHLDQMANVAIVEQTVSMELQRGKERKKAHAKAQAKLRQKEKQKDLERTKKIEDLETKLTEMTGTLKAKTGELADAKAVLEKAQKKLQSRWPDQTKEGSQSMSTITSFPEGNPVQKLFDGEPIDPDGCTIKSPKEETRYSRNNSLRDQVLRSIKFYIQKEEECKTQYWVAKQCFDKPTVPLQRISGGRWDFIINVQLEDGTFLFGYLIHTYRR